MLVGGLQQSQERKLGVVLVGKSLTAEQRSQHCAAQAFQQDVNCPHPARSLHVCATCNRSYVTPRSFLDLLAQYGQLLNASRTELGDKRRRLLDGIAKLNDTNSTLDAMRAQLSELQPLLAEKTAATSTLLQQVWIAVTGTGQRHMMAP